jgi:recombination protein RecA
MASLASIRAEVEERLSGRITAPFTARVPTQKTVLSTGIPAIDSIVGGIPCGEITEIVGSRWCSAGRKSLQSQLLARATKDQFCALIDATDSFDPKSARAAGVDLRRLLWIRCGGQGMKAMEQAFKSADLLLQGSGGFGFLALDLGGVSEKFVRRVPPTACGANWTESCASSRNWILQVIS